ncbi:hypothetical protein, partial [Kitasatospora indigofera]|uniref:hypothetical protein n=1 Tax=Kitasatospora indigofera TaxID=67307 RepID=UPI0036760BC0
MGIHGLLAFVSGALLLLIGAAAPAVAAGESVQVKIQAVAPAGGDPADVHVAAGGTQAFQVLWQCSGSNGSCLGGKIEVPVPLGQPDDIPLVPENIGALQIDGATVSAGALTG